MATKVDKRTLPGQKKQGKPATSRKRTEAQIKNGIAAYELWLDGYTMREIAAKQGVAVGTAHARVQWGRKDMVRAPVEELVDKHIDRCERLIKVHMAKAMDGEAGHTDTVIKLQAQIDSYHDIGRSKPGVTKTTFKTDGASVVVKSVTRTIVKPDISPAA